MLMNNKYDVLYYKFDREYFEDIRGDLNLDPFVFSVYFDTYIQKHFGPGSTIIIYDKGVSIITTVDGEARHKYIGYTQKDTLHDVPNILTTLSYAGSFLVGNEIEVEGINCTVTKVKSTDTRNLYRLYTDYIRLDKEANICWYDEVTELRSDLLEYCGNSKNIELRSKTEYKIIFDVKDCGDHNDYKNGHNDKFIYHSHDGVILTID